ncbi:hypothetical protein JNUCC42_14570 [Brevibacterium sp. JNUCC-42]|nr:hypothetical protein JNUCC42_14570 [Brevibacterium sp. JNUCC-42]
MIWGKVQENIKKAMFFLLIGMLALFTHADFANAQRNQGNKQTGITWLLYHQSDEYTTTKSELFLMLSLFQEKVIPINIDQQMPPQSSFDYLVYVGSGAQSNGALIKEWQQVMKKSHVPVYIVGGNPASLALHTPYKITGMIDEAHLFTIKGNRYPLDQIMDIPMLSVPYEKQSAITAFIENGVQKAPYLLADHLGVEGRPFYYSAQFVGTGELSYAFLDSLYDFYQQKVVTRHSLHVYLDGITLTSDPNKLLTKARLLKDLGIPFSISLNPIERGNQTDLRHYPDLAKALLLIQQDLGGQVVVKGHKVTLQPDSPTDLLNKKEILYELGISPIAVELPEQGLSMNQAMEAAPLFQQAIGLPDLGAEWPKVALSRPLWEQEPNQLAFYSKVPISNMEPGQYVSSALQQVQTSMIMRHTQMILPVPSDLPDAELKDLILRLKNMRVLFYFLPEGEGPPIQPQQQIKVDEQTRVQKASFYISWGLVIVVSSVVLYFLLEVSILRKKRAQRMFEESSKEVGGSE